MKMPGAYRDIFTASLIAVSTAKYAGAARYFYQNERKRFLSNERVRRHKRKV